MSGDLIEDLCDGCGRRAVLLESSEWLHRRPPLISINSRLDGPR